MADIYNDSDFINYTETKSSFVFFNTYVDVTLNSFQNVCCFFFHEKCLWWKYWVTSKINMCEY